MALMRSALPGEAGHQLGQRRQRVLPHRQAGAGQLQEVGGTWGEGEGQGAAAARSPSGILRASSRMAGRQRTWQGTRWQMGGPFTHLHHRLQQAHHVCLAGADRLLALQHLAALGPHQQLAVLAWGEGVKAQAGPRGMSATLAPCVSGVCNSSRAHPFHPCSWDAPRLPGGSLAPAAPARPATSRRAAHLGTRWPP